LPIHFGMTCLMNNFTERLQRMDEERRLYTLQCLPSHLAKMGLQEKLQKLLITFEFLQAKVEEFGPQPLIEDYEPVDEESFRLIQETLRLSEHVLADNSMQLAGQLHGRLLSHQSPVIQRLLEQAVPSFPWLRPLKESLIPPTSTPSHLY